MEKKNMSYALLFIFMLFLAVEIPLLASAASHQSKKKDVARFSYIVHVDKSMKPHHFSLHHDWYVAMIHNVCVASKSNMRPLLYTYDVVMHGFAAKLTSTEAKSMEKINGCLGVFPDSLNHLHTTRTPDFLKLSAKNGPWVKSRYGDDVIVGVLDSGIWPESKSFSGKGIGKQLPAKWKGKCEGGAQFNSSHCNNKLIGARYFLNGNEAVNGRITADEDYRSPRDSNGHGTHTASTAAGSAVPGSSLLGFAKGTARGMATKARLAVYKVCWRESCADSDILAGMEAAISDGVDVLSLSIVGDSDRPYYSDSIAIGAFAATNEGIFVSCSAGNSGPTPSYIFNTAPWIATVGASTIDRAFPAPVVLGNRIIYTGSSLYKGNTVNKQLPLVYGKTASKNGTANVCLAGSLDAKMVRRKIVVCDRGVNDRGEKALEVQQAGGAAMILANGFSNGDELSTDCYILPATIVGFNPGNHIKSYINSTRNPTASIELQGLTLVRKVRAPVVAGFSSRGPNPVVPQILKPDLVAPGVNILAAWTKRNSPTELMSDKRRVDYNIVSGTSMSCPHVSGIAALVHAAHPTWSPAAIKSALITSSFQVDNTRKPISDSFTKTAANPFVLGAGHVNPLAALDPGLVYDIAAQDYVRFLCSLNYTKEQIGILTKKASSCPRIPSQPGDLNYPSFSVIFQPHRSVHVTKRTVTNVGEAPCVYVLSVESPASVKISVQPQILVFRRAKEKVSYTVKFESKIASSTKTEGRQEFGRLTWKCVKGGAHVVRSPIAAVWTNEE